MSDDKSETRKHSGWAPAVKSEAKPKPRGRPPKPEQPTETQGDES